MKGVQSSMTFIIYAGPDSSRKHPNLSTTLLCRCLHTT
jgi:hypothetical protein